MNCPGSRRDRQSGNYHHARWQLPTSATGDLTRSPLAWAAFINCTKGGGEDGVSAKNFLLRLETRTRSVGSSSILVARQYRQRSVTSVGGPDARLPAAGRLGTLQSVPLHSIPAPTIPVPTTCGFSCTSAARPTSSATGASRFRSTTRCLDLCLLMPCQCQPRLLEMLPLQVEWHDCVWHRPSASGGAGRLSRQAVTKPLPGRRHFAASCPSQKSRSKPMKTNLSISRVRSPRRLHPRSNCSPSSPSSPFSPPCCCRCWPPPKSRR